MSYERLPWTDYFNEPSMEQLRAKLADEAVKLFDLARARLSEVSGATEKLKWFGDGWHWTIGYFLDRREDPLSIIIPAPEDLQIAMPLDREFINGLKADQIKKSLRDGLELAADPFQTRWAVWSLESESALADLISFTELKLQYLGKVAG